MNEKPKKTRFATPEQKEKFLTPIHEEKEEAKPPIYLLVLIFVLGVLLTAAFFIYTNKNQPPVVINPDQNILDDKEYKTVPITVIYTSDCKNCIESNTIEALFQVRKIPYKLTKLDANSNQAQQIIERFGIKTLPTALIDANKLKFYPSTVESFDSDFRVTKKGESYIVPELNLYPDRYFPVYFTEKVQDVCIENSSVALFDDFYAPQNSINRRNLYNFISDFNTTTEINFVYAQTEYSEDRNAQLANLFLMCASAQGKFAELERQMAGIYCNNPFKGDTTNLTDSEINGCWTLSDHYGTALTEQELNVALGRATLDVNAFKECYGQAKTLYNTAKNLVEELNITRTGTVLMDCRETTIMENLKAAFCKRHPQETKCMIADEIVDQNE